MRGTGEKTAVLLDRHPLWLAALTRLLDDVGVKVVGTTTSTAEALDLIEQTRPALFIAEYESIEQMQGSMSYRSVREPAAFERANYMKVLSSYVLGADLFPPASPTGGHGRGIPD